MSNTAHKQLQRLERCVHNASLKVAHAGQVMTAAKLAHAKALDELQLAQDKLNAALKSFITGGTT